jgi:hypothetical protein
VSSKLSRFRMGSSTKCCLCLAVSGRPNWPTPDHRIGLMCRPRLRAERGLAPISNCGTFTRLPP